MRTKIIRYDSQPSNFKEIPYLTEKRLGEHLKSLFPNHKFIHDKIVPESKNKKPS